MADNKLVAGPLTGSNPAVKEAVCISTNKVYDTCRDKDCLEDMRVYLDACSQGLVERAANVKVKKAEVIWAFIDVDAVPFNRGFYTVNITYYFRITLEVYLGGTKPTEICGLSTFTKKVILFGSEGTAKSFTSCYTPNDTESPTNCSTNLPCASVEVVEPVVLGVKVVEKCDCGCPQDADLMVPCCVQNCFDNPIGEAVADKGVYVSIGIFSIVRLERKVQILVPAYDFCVPTKECVDSSNDNEPCSLFARINFPTDEFFPPEAFKTLSSSDTNTCGSCTTNANCGCGCR
ncbi:hypothetical protein [Feifania hominis]|uniref:Uncharacterized protein n=1 Tax=Feifania hominis TaxID=2763660 RepID=A0A926DCF5_9FIRM|nr:hypothetical protein [Feifania hominis]MBC8535651.1 hypothetical protein [Feifania hominis]